VTDWSQVLERHGRVVWRAVRRLVNDDAEAADCFQETFVAALEYSRRHPVRNWSGLLKRLATTTAIDCLRKRMRTLHATETGDTSEATDRAPPPPAIVEGHELSARIRAEVAALPHHQAEVCCLRYLEGWSYDEIAVELNMTVNHVGVLLNRARDMLRHRLVELSPFAAGPNAPEVKS